MKVQNEPNGSATLVLMAALNEEEGIGLTIAELKQYLNSSHYLVVDGNSKDKTVHVAKTMGADVLYQRGKGKGDAIDFALQYLNHDDIDYVVLTDADYTYPAKYVPQMIKVLEEKPRVGMVCGNRFKSQQLPTDIMGNMFHVGNKLLAFTHDLMNGVHLNDPLTGLRVMRWDALKNWKPKSDGFDIEVELNHHIEKQGYDIIEIDIPYRARVGEKKLKAKHGLTIMKRIILERFVK